MATAIRGADIMGRDRAELYDQDYTKAEKRFGRALTGLTELMEEARMDGMRIKEVRLQGPAHTGSGFRAIVKVEDEARHPYVAWRNGATAEDVVKQVVDGYNDGSLLLKEDKPWTPPEAPAAPRKSKRPSK